MIGELFINLTQVVLAWVFVLSPNHCVWLQLNAELSRTLSFGSFRFPILVPKGTLNLRVLLFNSRCSLIVVKWFEIALLKQLPLSYVIRSMFPWFGGLAGDPMAQYSTRKKDRWMFFFIEGFWVMFALPWN